MKRILFLLLLFCSLSGIVLGQSYNKNLSSYSYLVNRMTFDSTLILPYHDTTINSSLYRSGVIVFTTDHNLCIWNGHYWDVFKPFSGGGDTTDVSAYWDSTQVKNYVTVWTNDQGFLKMEQDPVYITSIAYNINEQDTLNWDSAYVRATYDSTSGDFIFYSIDGRQDTFNVKNGENIPNILAGQGIRYDPETGEVSVKLSNASGNAASFDGGGGLYVPLPVNGGDTTVKGVIYNPKVDDTIRLTTNTLDTIKAKMHLETAIDSGVFISAQNQLRLYQFNGDSIVMNILGSAVTSVNGNTGNVQLNLSIVGRTISITGGNSVTVPHDSLALAGNNLSIKNSNTVNLSTPINSLINDSLAEIRNTLNNKLNISDTSNNWLPIGTHIPEQVNLIEGSNITITGDYPNLTISASGGGSGTDSASVVKSPLTKDVVGTTRIFGADTTILSTIKGLNDTLANKIVIDTTLEGGSLYDIKPGYGVTVSGGDSTVLQHDVTVKADTSDSGLPTRWWANKSFFSAPTTNLAVKDAIAPLVAINGQGTDSVDANNLPGAITYFANQYTKGTPGNGILLSVVGTSYGGQLQWRGSQDTTYDGLYYRSTVDKGQGGDSMQSVGHFYQVASTQRLDDTAAAIRADISSGGTDSSTTGRYPINVEIEGTHRIVSFDTSLIVVDTTNMDSVSLSSSNIDTVLNISQLESYSGPAYILYVEDTLRGGIFHKTNENLDVDSGIVFNAVSGYKWVRNLGSSHEVNVTWWGANGTDDNWDADYIQKALDYAGLHPQKNTVYVPKGRYLLQYTLLMSNKTTLRGDHPQFSPTSTLSGKNGSLLSLKNYNEPNTYYDSITIEGIDFNNKAIAFARANNVIIRDVRTSNTSYSGNHTIDISSINGGLIENNYLQGIHTTSFGSFAPIQISGAHSDGTSQYSVNLPDGSVYDDDIANHDPSKNIVVRNNIIKNSDGAIDIHGMGVNNIFIYNNSIDNDTISTTVANYQGIIFSSNWDSTQHNIHIFNNNFYNARHAISTQGYTDSLFVYNNNMNGWNQGFLYMVDNAYDSMKHAFFSNNTINGQVINGQAILDTNYLFQLRGMLAKSDRTDTADSYFSISKNGTVDVKNTFHTHGINYFDGASLFGGINTGIDGAEIDGLGKGYFVNVQTTTNTSTGSLTINDLSNNASLDSVLIVGTDGTVMQKKFSSGGSGTTDLAQGTRTSTTVPITNSNGTGVTLSSATTSLAGVMTAADKTKLNGLANVNLSPEGNLKISGTYPDITISQSWGNKFGNTVGGTYIVPDSVGVISYVSATSTDTIILPIGVQFPGREITVNVSQGSTDSVHITSAGHGAVILTYDNSSGGLYKILHGTNNLGAGETVTFRATGGTINEWWVIGYFKTEDAE